MKRVVRSTRTRKNVGLIDKYKCFFNIFLIFVVWLSSLADRALELTAVCLRFNPANYTTWWFRRQILASQSLPEQDKHSKFTYFSQELICKDLQLVSKLGGSNPKNYQIWYHRRSFLEHSFSEIATGSTDEKLLNLLEDELKYIASVFDEDAKNYHVSFSLYIYIYIETNCWCMVSHVKTTVLYCSNCNLTHAKLFMSCLMSIQL